ncbi:MAG: outer membrane protein assembly factor BamD [Candidatus Kapabacteria bacterium]|nr:outer membrane protein assembly factor BamD [Candidatus Kapabacteria bacterium]
MKRFFLIVILFSISLLIISCSSSKVTEIKSAEEMFKRGVELFNDNDLLEASKVFDIIKLQYPASQFADDAQYYLAEINFKKDEFILAAFNYNMLRRLYPNSEYSKISMYKTALSYYNLSPDPERDQEYTLKAIDAFQDFQRAYPRDSLYQQAGIFIQELRNKLAEKNYNIAKLYRTIYSPNSAIIYLDFIIEDFPDTKFYDLAVIMKTEILIEQNKFEEAKFIINTFKSNFPNSQNLPKILSLEKNLNK